MTRVGICHSQQSSYPLMLWRKIARIQHTYNRPLTTPACTAQSYINRGSGSVEVTYSCLSAKLGRSMCILSCILYAFHVTLPGHKGHIILYNQHHTFECFQVPTKHVDGNHISPTISHTQRVIHDNRVYDNDSLSDGWALCFESLTTPVDIPFTNKQLLIQESYYPTQSMPVDEPDLVSEEEVRSIIHSLPLTMAAVPDHLTNEHLKFGGSMLSAILTSPFNANLISGLFLPLSNMDSLYQFLKVTIQLQRYNPAIGD